jgi:deoxycytidylate deaminase
MAAVQKLESVPAVAHKGAGDKTLIDRFKSRSSKEIVIGFAGPIGCGIKSVIDDTVKKLNDRGYDDVVLVKLSTFLQESLDQKLISVPAMENGASNRFNRYRRLQEAGKALRISSRNPAILAEYAMKKIAVDRRTRNPVGVGEDAPPLLIPKRTAYLIDQVKRPEEVALLRAVYRNIFYLVGVTRVYDRRVAALRQEDIRIDEIHRLMEIDRLEAALDGQQLDKTLHLSDFFIRNDSATVEEKGEKICRVLDLIHGDRSITPTDGEQGMYAAYAAGMRSACLSRQVGAALVSAAGEIISTGCNDVPKSGGGLYSASSKGTDMRCVHREEQHCFNDFHKRKLQTEIGSQVSQFLKRIGEADVTRKTELTGSELAELISEVYKNTRLKDLIEFSRSVHAEMDAIITVGRQGGSGLLGSTLYTTTFPCHSCARHIVSAGISRVFYVEPYEKSMARDLHDDAIAFDTEEAPAGSGKVQFLHFEGVSPRQFQNFFRAVSRKDDQGKFVRIQPRTAEKTVPEYLDNYQDFETKAVQHLDLEVEKMQQEVRERTVDK